MSQDNQDSSKDNQHHSRGLNLGTIVSIVTILGFGFAIFVWFIPNYHSLFPPKPIVANTTNYCGNITAQTVCIYGSHKGSVNTVAWSPDGQRIASGGNDGTVQVWNARTGSTLVTYRGHKGSIGVLAWSPDGQQIASGGSDGTVQVWYSNNGTLVYPPINELSYVDGSKSTSPITSLAWSPNGQYIAFARDNGSIDIFAADIGSDDNNAQMFNCSTNTNINKSNFGPVAAIAWSSDSSLLAAACIPSENSNVSPGDPNIVGVWNISHYPPTISGIYHPDGQFVKALAWSPNGKFIATFENAVEIYSGLLNVWNPSKPNDPSAIGVGISFGHPNVSAIAWSLNSKCLALGSTFSGDVEVWSLAAQKQVDLYTGQVGNINAVAWSPDGTQIASASTKGTVNVWKVSQGGACFV
jgi:WD40 repeat protein